MCCCRRLRCWETCVESAQHLKVFLSCCFTHEMTLRILLLALKMIESHGEGKYFYFTQYDTCFETGTSSTTVFGFVLDGSCFIAPLLTNTRLKAMGFISLRRSGCYSGEYENRFSITTNAAQPWYETFESPARPFCRRRCALILF